MAAMFVNGSGMSSLYIRPSRDASYHDSVHLAQWFQRRCLGNRPIINKNCLWRPCLSTDRDEMSNLIRGPSRGFLPSFCSFGQAVSEEKIFQKSATNQKQELSVAAMFVNRSGRNQQSLQRIFRRCFLPSVGSFG